MWSMVTAFFIGRAVGGWRYIRVALLAVLIGCLIIGVLYAVAVFKTVWTISEAHHVQYYAIR